MGQSLVHKSGPPLSRPQTPRIAGSNRSATRPSLPAHAEMPSSGDALRQSARERAPWGGARDGAQTLGRQGAGRIASLFKKPPGGAVSARPGPVRPRVCRPGLRIASAEEPDGSRGGARDGPSGEARATLLGIGKHARLPVRRGLV